MTWRPWVTVRILLVLGLGVGLFFVAFFGDDGFNSMPKEEVTTVTSFLEKADPGPIYCPTVVAPLADTARYDQFPLTDIFGTATLAGQAPVRSNIATLIANLAQRATGGRAPAYVLVTPTMLTYSQSYGIAPPGSFSILLRSLARSQAWKLIVNRAGTVIYELPPANVRRLCSAGERGVAVMPAGGAGAGDLVAAGGYGQLIGPSVEGKPDIAGSHTQDYVAGHGQVASAVVGPGDAYIDVPGSG